MNYAYRQLVLRRHHALPFRNIFRETPLHATTARYNSTCLGNSLNRQQQTYSMTPNKYMSSSSSSSSSSPFQSSGGGKKLRRRKRFIPRKAAVQLTDQAREFFKRLLEANPEKAGVLLNYHQASSGEPRMVFSFSFATSEELSPEDEGVSLELLDDGTPKPPDQSWEDGLPKLYVHHNAFMKVLGATVDVDMENVVPILTDREGNRLDPNA